MFTLKQAKAQVQNLTAIHGEPWLIFKTPAGAACNQYPGNVFNKGPYAVCKASERADYEAGGCEFIREVT
jgi:hypothetical protein